MPRTKLFLRKPPPPKADYERWSKDRLTPVKGEIHPRFVGKKRRELIDDVLVHVNDPTKSARQEIVQATRRFGKTELIRQIVGRSSHYKNVVTIDLDGQGVSQKLLFYQRLAQQLGLKISSQDPEEIKMACLLEIDAKAQKGERVLILLDEMATLYDADPEFMRELRRRHDTISILFVSFLEHEKHHSEEKRKGAAEASSSHSPSLNHFTKKPLPHLEAVDVSHYISSLLFGSVKYGQNLSPGFVQAITLLSGGNVCMIGSLLFDMDYFGKYDWQKALATDTKDPDSFIVDMVSSISQFYDRVSYQFEELIIKPYEGSKAFGINPSLILKMMVEMALKQGRTSFTVESQTFGNAFFKNLGIPEDEIPVFHRILDHFEAVGFIHRRVVDGKTEISFANFPLILCYGRRLGSFSEQQIIRIWNGETITPTQAQKETAAEMALPPHPPITEDDKRALIASLTEDFDSFFNDNRPQDERGIDLSAWLNEITGTLENAFLGENPTRFFISFMDENASLLPLIANVVGRDLSRLFDFMLCVWQMAPEKLTFNQTHTTSLNLNAQVVAEALALYFAQRTNENYFPNWHDVRINDG